MTTPTSRALKVLFPALVGLVVLPGCARDYTFSPVDMWNRSRLKPYEPINFFDDNLSSRPLPPGTIARGELRNDDALFRGTEKGRFVNVIPPGAIRGVSEKEVIQRGQERYNIYCLPCHGLSGHGDGMIVRRGFSPPPDYRITRLRNAPVGHFYDVISNGYGAMYSYASRVPVNDRWAIAAYIRRLQKVEPETVPDIRYSPAKLKALYGTQDTNTIGVGSNYGSSSQMKPGGGFPESKALNQALPQAPSGTRADGDTTPGVAQPGTVVGEPGGNPALPSSGSTATQGSKAFRGVPSQQAPRKPAPKYPTGQGGRVF